MKLIFFTSFLIIFTFAQSQEIVNSENIGDCYGAVSLKKENSFQAEFTGKAGFNNDVFLYNESLDLEPFNTLWLKFEDQISGSFTFNIKGLPRETEIAVFETSQNEKCNKIHEGDAKIIYHLPTEKVKEKIISTLEIKKDKVYYLYINTKKEGKPYFSIHSSYQPLHSDEEINALLTVKDLREDRTGDKFTIAVVDEDTRLPIDASIIVKNTKSHNALYDANVMVFPNSEYLAFDLEINAVGYFFKDVSFARRDSDSDTLIIEMKPVKTNDQIELEGLQFESQSDVLLESAKGKIRRLRDFMALNKNINIEVVGHVYKEGKNTWKAKQLSKQRAKRVKDYLEESGIDPNRISVEGKGNSEMIYPQPENDIQIQANRRVEVKIK